MTEDRAYLDKQRGMAAPGAAEDPKSRQCLKCRKQFPSEWAGQRVCARCKNRSEWRSGALPRSY
ncbi:MAG: hypothetical protein GEU87_16080 [Alphaproteobacteria bacterium]|nr:hypothetical protein [Alphaproteobacteria bacterium]